MDEPYLREWLNISPKDPDSQKFSRQSLSERPDIRVTILPRLARHIFTYHRDPESYNVELKKRMENLGYAGAVAQILDLPKGIKLRHGGFGEVLACEFLKQTMGYIIPVYRLRYRQHSQVSPPGEDLVAIKIDPQTGSREVIVGEAKVRQQFRNKVVEDAYSQIKKTKPRPESLSFILTVLFDKDRKMHDQLIDIGDEYCSNPFVRKFFIMLITANNPTSPFSTLDEDNSRRIIKNLLVADFAISDLAEFVQQIFEMAPEYYGEQ